MYEWVYGVGGLDEFAAQFTDGAVDPDFFLLDASSDVVGLVDSLGNLVRQFSYRPYGKLYAAEDGSGNSLDHVANPEVVNTRFGHHGYYYDAETGLYYARARHYDPFLGRFRQRNPNEVALVYFTAIMSNASSAAAAAGLNPLGHYAGGMNLYAYNRSNPLTYSDPLGLEPYTQRNHIYPVFLGGRQNGPQYEAFSGDHTAFHNVFRKHGFKEMKDVGRWRRLSRARQREIITEALFAGGIDVSDKKVQQAINDSMEKVKRKGPTAYSKGAVAGSIRKLKRWKKPWGLDAKGMYHREPNIRYPLTKGRRALTVRDMRKGGGLGKKLAVGGAIVLFAADVYAGTQAGGPLASKSFELAELTAKIRATSSGSIMDEVDALAILVEITEITNLPYPMALYGWTLWRTNTYGVPLEYAE